MARRSARGGDQVSRGVHRAGPTGTGPLANLTSVLGSTVPKRVRPPQPLRVLTISGIVVGLVLLGYSTTLVNLRFTEPPMEDTPQEAPNSQLPAGDPSPDQDTVPESLPPAQGADTVQPEASPSSPEPSGQATPEPQQDEAQETNQDSANAGEVSVTYGMTQFSEENFGAQLVITNGGADSLSPWEIEVAFEDARLVTAWQTDWEPTESGARFHQPQWHDNLAPGESATVQFSAQGTPQTPDCTINGRSCHL